jgi:hypothetical protein
MDGDHSGDFDTWTGRFPDVGRVKNKAEGQKLKIKAERLRER